MKKKISRQFICYNMLIISMIAIILAAFVYFGSSSPLSVTRLFITVILMLVLVFAGSLLLSRFAVKPISKAWQKQLEFTTDASHELRTPLAVMRTSLELVMDSPSETVASQMKWLKNAAAENCRMTKLVNDLLTLSRADAHQLALDKKTFMLNELIEDVLQSSTPLAKSSGITCSLLTDSPIAIHADQDRIKQLVLILADNAVHYTRSGGTVTFSLFKTKDSILLTVEDTGVGISDVETGKVFDRFFRSVNTRKMHRDGSGLGLAVAKWIVSAHDGNIRVESTLGKGSKFIVALPSS